MDSPSRRIKGSSRAASMFAVSPQSVQEKQPAAPLRVGNPQRAEAQGEAKSLVSRKFGSIVYGLAYKSMISWAAATALLVARRQASFMCFAYSP
jgi:hypothetical protein